MLLRVLRVREKKGECGTHRMNFKSYENARKHAIDFFGVMFQREEKLIDLSRGYHQAEGVLVPLWRTKNAKSSEIYTSFSL
jgi:hypothetical protein